MLLTAIICYEHNSLKGGERLQKFYAVEKKDKKAVISIYSDIYSGSGLPKKINEMTDVDEIEVHISSYGGEVVEGLAIYNALKNHKAKVTTINDGFACSIASVIFCAGDRRLMNESSLVMIHNAWVWTCGNADDLRKEADDLEKVSAQAVKIYESVSNLSADDIRSFMDKESWLEPQDCIDYQFATEIIKNADSDKATQSIRNKIFKILNTKTEVTGMDPVTVGNYTVEATEDGGLKITPLENSGEETTEQRLERIEKFINSLGGK